MVQIQMQTGCLTSWLRFIPSPGDLKPCGLLAESVPEEEVPGHEPLPPLPQSA